MNSSQERFFRRKGTAVVVPNQVLSGLGTTEELRACGLAVVQVQGYDPELVISVADRIFAVPLTEFESSVKFKTGEVATGGGQLNEPQNVDKKEFEDVPGLSVSTRLNNQGRIRATVVAESQGSVEGKPATHIARIVIESNATTPPTVVSTGREYSRYLNGTNDVGLFPLTHLTEELPAGTYTIKVQHRIWEEGESAQMNGADFIGEPISRAKTRRLW